MRNKILENSKGAHVEGQENTVSGESAHAEGKRTTAEGFASHAEGWDTEAIGESSHAEGYATKATTYQAHAEGDHTTANGEQSHAEGLYTITRNSSEHAQGQYNVSNSGKTIHSVGIGTSSQRKNAHEITKDGKHYILNIGGYDGTTLNGATDVATEIANLSEMINDLQNTKIDKEADDYYPKMAVGTADNLAGVEVVSSEFTTRQSGGGAIADGVARVQSIKGNSVVWNQLALSQGAKGSYDNSTGGSISYQSTGLLVNYTEQINGHKVFMSVIDKIGIIPYFYFADNIQYNLLGGVIVTANTTQHGNNGIIARVPAGVNASWDIDCLLVDLTKMFGEGNEPSTIEEFYQRIPMEVDLHAYNEGEVISMNVNGIKSVGVKEGEESTEDLSIVAKYFPNGMNGVGSAYDEIRYNKAANKWEKVQRFSKVDMGTLSYSKSGVGANAFYTIALQGIVKKGGKMISAIFELVGGITDANKFLMSVDTAGTIYFNCPQISDAASFKVAMSGVILYYELAEPIVTEIEEKDFNLDYLVWNGGTEEAIASKPSSALRAEITYGFNAVGKIKELEEKINSGGGGGVSKEYVDTKVTELSTEVGNTYATKIYVNEKLAQSGGQGGGEPSQYIKEATTSADGNTLTLIKKDNTQVVFSPSGSGGGGSADLSAIAKWGVLTQALKQVGNANDGYVVQVSNPTYGWIPQSFIDEVTNFGGVATNANAGYITSKPIFNETTGYFEYQGITNLAYDEMRAAYTVGRNMFSNGIGNYLYAVQYRDNITSGVSDKFRCILHYPTFNEMGYYRFHGFCRYLKFLEIGVVNEAFGAVSVIDGGLNYAFEGCATLRSCGYFEVSQLKSTPSAFTRNPSIEEVYLKGLKVNINFGSSPLLKEECILYMIQNAGATGITITLHPTAYDRAMANEEITAAMASKQVNLAFSA